MYPRLESDPNPGQITWTFEHKLKQVTDICQQVGGRRDPPLE